MFNYLVAGFVATIALTVIPEMKNVKQIKLYAFGLSFALFSACVYGFGKMYNDSVLNHNSIGEKHTGPSCILSDEERVAFTPYPDLLKSQEESCAVIRMTITPEYTAAGEDISRYYCLLLMSAMATSFIGISFIKQAVKMAYEYKYPSVDAGAGVNGTVKESNSAEVEVQGKEQQQPTTTVLKQ